MNRKAAIISRRIEVVGVFLETKLSGSRQTVKCNLIEAYPEFVN
jgi:hypothetical protein